MKKTQNQKLKFDETLKSPNKKMNPEVYRLRRKVMDYIYEAKNLFNGNLPRITIRIIDNMKGMTAVARMNKNIIWVTPSAIESANNDLRRTVFHELGHTLLGLEHIENCPLMSSANMKISKEEIHRIFNMYASNKWANDKSNEIGKDL